MSLFDALVRGLIPAHRAAALTATPSLLEAQVDAVVAVARAEWPGVDVPVETFAVFLGERLDGELPLMEALAAARGADLWIACACGAGDKDALTAFERKYFEEIRRAVGRAPRARLHEDDVAQLVRERLFVAAAGSTPKILEYRGRGSMRAWLRVTAARIVLNLATRGPREEPEEDEWFARVVANDESAEIAHLKSKYRTEFRAALEVAVAALDPKDRNVLAYSFGERLSIDQIGGIYGVHRATAARWITHAQEQLVLHTRTALMDRLGASAAEVDSIVHLIASRFDVTFGGLLRGPPTGA